MKKYTTPEVEIIKFQIQEAIADNESGVLNTSGGSKSVTNPDGTPVFDR